MILESDQFSNHIQSIIHKNTQQHRLHFDLTIRQIYEFTEAGSLDFGGSEFRPAEKQKIKTQKKNKNDTYGWWHLPRGIYQAEINEELVDVKNKIGILTPHIHLRKAGLMMNTVIIPEQADKEALTINFSVPKPGCDIKENARFAVLFLLAI